MPSSNPLSKSRPRSEASLILENEGISQAKLAGALRMSTSSLSRMLRGVQPLPFDFDGLLHAALGPELSRRLIAAVPRTVRR